MASSSSSSPPTVRATATTCAPAFASASAGAWPMPREAPVTSAMRSERGFMGPHPEERCAAPRLEGWPQITSGPCFETRRYCDAPQHEDRSWSTGNRARRSSRVRRRAFLEVHRVRRAQFRGLLVIEEGQERVAAPPRHGRDAVHQRAGEHDRAAGRHLEATRAIFGKADLSALEIVVEVDRHREAAVRRALGGVVAMRMEVSAVLRRVAGDDVALHAD